MQVLIFGAPWCASCQVLKKSLDGVTLSGFEIEHIDMDVNPELAVKHGVKSLPTVVVPEMGIVRSGVTTVKQLAALIAR
jgi:thioredoxin-like negative regulator of GroEL